MGLVKALLASSAFRTFLTGAGFFSDSYDLFITDGVTNILKDLGPVTKVTYTFTKAGEAPTNATCFFSSYCTTGTKCLPNVYNSGTGLWERNPASTWSPEYTPRYQLQTPALKNAVSNAALIGSITGQVTFGFAGDVLGRKWCFVLTTLLIILGCLGSASAAAGSSVAGATSEAGCWATSAALPSAFAQDVYGQLVLWRAILGFGVGGEYPLAGTIASEGAKDTASRGRAVLYTFSMQGWGKLTASLVNYFLVRNLTFFGGAWEMDASWRFALAFGCLLNLLTLPFRWYMEESHIFQASSKTVLGEGGEQDGAEGKGSTSSSSSGEAAAAATASGGQPAALDEVGFVALPPPPKPEHVAKASRVTMELLWGHRWTLVGTASTWFLIDVTFYGQRRVGGWRFPILEPPSLYLPLSH
jgi:MFS family permease